MDDGRQRSVYQSGIRLLCLSAVKRVILARITAFGGCADNPFRVEHPGVGESGDTGTRHLQAGQAGAVVNVLLLELALEGNQNALPDDGPLVDHGPA